MTWYQKLTALQEPFDVGLDDNGRAQVSFNVMATKASSDTFLQELISLLVDGSVGEFAPADPDDRNIFVSSKDQIPAEGGPFLSLTATGGAAPVNIHNDINPPAYPRQTAQIIVRSPDFLDALGMAQAARAVFELRSKDVTP